MCLLLSTIEIPEAIIIIIITKIALNFVRRAFYPINIARRI